MSNRNVRDQLFRRRVDDGYGVANVVSAVDAISRGRDAQTTGASPGGNNRYLVGGGINHVHLPRGLVRDICEASIGREQDVFAPIPGKIDNVKDGICCRINNIDGAPQTMLAALMHNEKTRTIWRDSFLSGPFAHRDSGNVRLRHRV